MSKNIADALFDEIKKCNFCKLCEENCSIFLVLGKYAPYEKLEVIKEIIKKPKSEKPKNWEGVFLCTKCEACDECCPENIPLTKIIDLGRYICVNKWGIQYPRQNIIIKNIYNFGNPFAMQKNELECLEEFNSKSNTLLHLGCMISYRLSSMGRKIIKILKKLKIDFNFSSDFRCCGYFIYNTGNHKDAQRIILQNLKEFNKYDQIITACAGCYTFLKEHYPLKIPIKHVIEIIFEKIKDIDFKSDQIEKNIVFQDSCHIARPHGIVEPPREIIKKMGLELIEFDRPLCCGADGGMRIINLEVALKVGKMRLLESKAKGDALVTLCPFCIAHFRDTAEKFNINIQIMSLFEILEKLLP